MNAVRHFLKATDLNPEEVRLVFDSALRMKRHRAQTPRLLAGQSWGLLFFKNSTRTRISFDVGLNELGAHPLFLDSGKTQLGRGESVADTARVLSRYLHGLIVRCHEHSILETLAEAGTIPVINALTDWLHPCQTYADAFTLAEHLAPEATHGEARLEALKGRKLAFFGDTASNMANSLALTGAYLGMEVVLCGPKAYQPGDVLKGLMQQAGFADKLHYTEDPEVAAKAADALYTDVWVSMGDEGQAQARKEAMAPYQVNQKTLKLAHKHAVFLHCLPAHPGEEVTQEVLGSPASIIFDQAENRLHIQKAILCAVMGVHP